MGCCSSKAIDFTEDANLFHFSLLRNVGKGAFGKVRVVRHKGTGNMYALKYIDKQKCVKMRAVVNIVQERRLLEEIDHAYIVNLRYAFQDDENCFFVLDLMLGGDLRFHLDRTQKLSEEVVRFWIAELAGAVAYLHDKRIVHRDLKPDNILLSADGHAHLTDFNIAVHLPPAPKHLSGVAGSMAYMAPDVLARRGYGTAVDWWSLGVCAFELLTGRRPFRGQSNDELKASIMSGAVGWPSSESRGSSAARETIGRFLDRNPQTRLGARSDAMQGLDDVRRQPWFAGLDWDALDRKELPSPYVPDPNKAHFDATYDLEELLLEDNPLRARERKVRDPSKLSPELQQLEDQFTNYDYMRMRRRSYYPQSAFTTSMISSRPATPATLAMPDEPMPAHVKRASEEGPGVVYGVAHDGYAPQPQVAPPAPYAPEMQQRQYR